VTRRARAELDGREVYAREDRKDADQELGQSFRVCTGFAVTRWARVQLDGREVYVREDREDADLKQALGGEPGAARPKRGRPSGGAGAPGYAERGPPLGGPRGGPGPPPYGGGGGGGEVLLVGRRVVVEGLGPDTTWKTLKDHFRAAGAVLHADVLPVRPGRGLCARRGARLARGWRRAAGAPRPRARARAEGPASRASGRVLPALCAAGAAPAAFLARC